MSNDGKKLPPGHYVVTPDPDGELHLGFGLRARILSRRPDPPSALPARPCGEAIDQFVHCVLPEGHTGPCRNGAWSSEP